MVYKPDPTRRIKDEADELNRYIQHLDLKIAQLEEEIVDLRARNEELEANLEFERMEGGKQSGLD